MYMYNGHLQCVINFWCCRSSKEGPSGDNFRSPKTHSIGMTITYYTKNVLPYNCFKFSLDKGFQQIIHNKEQSKFHLVKVHVPVQSM